jgi:hypothetical protein
VVHFSWGTSIPSPIEQNKRHIYLLDLFLRAKGILPKRIGIAIRPKLRNLILVSPNSIIKRPSQEKFDTSMIIQADSLRTKIDEIVDMMDPLADLSSFSKISSSSALKDVGKRLASFHKPIRIDFRAKFGLSIQTSSKPEENPVHAKEQQKTYSSLKFICSKCKKPISEKVAKFCSQNKSKFGGRLYCFDCQKSFEDLTKQ